MEKVEFKPEYFIEGSQKPEEEPSYWKFLRGEQIELSRIKKEGEIYVLAVESMIIQGRACLKDGLVSLKERR